MTLASLAYAKPLQEQGELSKLAGLLSAERLYSYLEIGARYGGSFETIMRALPVGSYGMAIDLPGGPFGDPDSAPILLAAAARLRRDGYGVDVVFADSQSSAAYGRASAAGPFDAVMIDGNHSYDGVRSDFEVFAPLGRMVVLHDVAAPADLRSSKGLPVEVPRFWQEIKGAYRHLEIIDPGSVMGIGVLWMDQRTGD